MLTQRFEQARVTEARDTSTFQILDQPTLPTKKVRPKRLVVSLLGLLGGALLAGVWLLAPPWWRSRSLGESGAGAPVATRGPARAPRKVRSPDVDDETNPRG